MNLKPAQIAILANTAPAFVARRATSEATVASGLIVKAGSWLWEVDN